MKSTRQLTAEQFHALPVERQVSYLMTDGCVFPEIPVPAIREQEPHPITSDDEGNDLC